MVDLLRCGEYGIPLWKGVMAEEYHHNLANLKRVVEAQSADTEKESR